jgi:dsRNA-specific ribonuclease
LGELPLAQGEGRSKKQAAQMAARLALENLPDFMEEEEGGGEVKL